MKKSLLTGLLSLSLVSLFGQNIVYVDANATGNATGLSWADAFTNLDLAISASPGNSHYWVKAGLYRQQFTIDKSAVIIGGFNGTETMESQANPLVNVTLFDGDYLGNDTPGDMVTGKGDNFPYLCEVVASNLIGFNASISGLYFQYAYNDNGGGSAIILSNNLSDSTINLSVSKCFFLFNACNGQDAGGGAVRVVAGVTNATANAEFDKCVFKGNETFGNNNVRGSVMMVHALNSATSTAKITNSLFEDNTDTAPFGNPCTIFQAASSVGSGNSTSTLLYNNTFVSDGSTSRPVWYWNGGSGTTTGQFYSNIIDASYTGIHVGSTTTSANTYSISAQNNLWPAVPTEDATGLVQISNILNNNPGFVNAAGGNYQLTSASPCIDAGYASTQSAGLLPDNQDLQGQARFNNNVDMGALEYQGPSSVQEHLQVSSLIIFPNPCANQCFIQSEHNTSASVVDITGAIILNVQLVRGQNSIDVSSLAAGTYFILTSFGHAERFVRM